LLDNHDYHISAIIGAEDQESQILMQNN